MEVQLYAALFGDSEEGENAESKTKRQQRLKSPNARHGMVSRTAGWFVDKLGHGGKAKLHGSPHLPMLHMFRTKMPQNEKAPPTIIMCTDRAEPPASSHELKQK